MSCAGARPRSRLAASASVQALLKDLNAARAQVDLLISAARVALPADQHPAGDDAKVWAKRLRSLVPSA